MTIHNPNNISGDKFGQIDGWRLLLKEELRAPPADTQYSAPCENWKFSPSGGGDLRQIANLTFRTKAPVPAQDPLDLVAAFLS